MGSPDVPYNFTPPKMETSHDTSGDSSISLNGVSDEVVNLEINSPQPEEQDSCFICIKIRDIEGGFAPTPTTILNCGRDTTIGNFIDEVVGMTSLSVDDFEIIYQRPGKTYELTDLPRDQKLTTIELAPSREKTYSMCLQRKTKRRVSRNLIREFALNGHAYDDGSEDVDVEVHTVPFIGPHIYENGQEELDLPVETIPEQTLDLASLASGEYQEDFDFNDDDGHDMVGLQNQQYTCYLNSLIQALYACPELRNMIYSTQIEHSSSHRSVILALRKLFLQLQFSKRKAVSTRELTRTFGWKDDEHHYQQDINELYRLLIDKLQEESPSRSLFGGIYSDSTRCLKCGGERSVFTYENLLMLPIIDYTNSENRLSTLESVFELYSRANTITDYYCDRDSCGCQTHAHIHARPVKLPYIFNINLTRYSLCGLKITDEITCPFIFDLNKFVKNEPNLPPEVEKLVPPVTPELIGNNLMKPLDQRTEHSRPISGWKSKMITYPVPDPKQEEIEAALKTGPNVYRLYSVLVHKGATISSGHYIAYVYCLERHKWYYYSDSICYETDETAVRNSFGGSNRKRDGEAYILMYRRVDHELNSLPMTMNELPEETLNLWKEVEQEDLQEYERETFEKRIIRERISVRHSGHMYGIQYFNDVPIWKRSTFREAALQAYKHTCGRDSDIGLVRFVKFDKETGTCIESYEKKENLPFGQVYKDIMSRFNKNCHELLLEVNLPLEVFQVYREDDLVFKAHLTDHKNHTIVKAKEIHFRKHGEDYNVGSLYEILSYEFSIPLENIFVAIAIDKEASFLLDYSVKLCDLPVDRVSEIVCESIDPLVSTDLLRFANEFYHSFHFSLEFENVPPPPSLNDTIEIEHEESSPSDETFESEGDSYNSRNKVEIEHVFSLELEGNETGKSSTTCDFNSSSDDRKTTDMDENDNGASPASGNSSSSYTIEPLAPKRTGRFLVCSPISAQEEHFFTILHDFSGEFSNNKRFYVRVFSGVTLSYLSKKIEQLFGIDEANTIIFSVYSCPRVYSETELTVIDDTKISEIERFTGFRLRFGQRLKPGEMRMPVYILDFGQWEQEEQKPICEVILDSSLNGSEAREACFHQLRELVGLDPICLDEYRLRRRRNSNPSKVIRKSSCLLSELFTSGFGELMVQPLTGPDTLTQMSHPIILRRFHPATLTLGPPFEVILHPGLETPEKILHGLISEATGIPEDQVEYSICEGHYPFTVHPVHLVEGVQWSNFRGGVRKLILTHTEECALYIRDRKEEPAEITASMRKQYEKENNPNYYSPVKNRQMVIDLSRTPT